MTTCPHRNTHTQCCDCARWLNNVELPPTLASQEVKLVLLDCLKHFMWRGNQQGALQDKIKALLPDWEKLGLESSSKKQSDDTK